MQVDTKQKSCRQGLESVGGGGGVNEEEGVAGVKWTSVCILSVYWSLQCHCSISFHAL